MSLRQALANPQQSPNDHRQNLEILTRNSNFFAAWTNLETPLKIEVPIPMVLGATAIYKTNNSMIKMGSIKKEQIEHD